MAPGREVMRCHHFSHRTEQTYLDWIRRLIVFQGKRHPREMGLPHASSIQIPVSMGVSLGRRGFGSGCA